MSCGGAGEPVARRRRGSGDADEESDEGECEGGDATQRGRKRQAEEAGSSDGASGPNGEVATEDDGGDVMGDGEAGDGDGGERRRRQNKKQKRGKRSGAGRRRGNDAGASGPS